MQQVASKEKYPALFLEGGDSVGKNELLRSIAKYLLLTDTSRKLLLFNFPQFWFFGHDARLLIRGVCDEILNKVSSVENAFLRASMFGMDRNIALLLAEPYLEKDSNIFVLSDRGPFSSCVTTGYLWANGILTDEQVGNDIVPDMFYTADAGMFSFFSVNSLLCTVEGKFSLGARKSLDNYESELPQQYSYDVYRMMELPEITTKNSDGWRDRQLLVHEALERSGYAHMNSKIVLDDVFTKEDILINAYKEGRLILIGPQTLVEHFHVAERLDEKTRSLIDTWIELSLTSKVSSTKDRKEVLDEIETQIALALKRMTPVFDYAGAYCSDNASEAIQTLLKRYPVLYEILEKTSGSAMTGFLDGLLRADQLRLA